MKVLVVGGGGREHALCWKLAQSPKVDKIYVAPGNAGCALVAERVDLKANQIDPIVSFVHGKKIDLTVVGPEAPLCAGLVDRLQKLGHKVFGPSQEAAKLEGSKTFAKQLARQHNVPSPDFKVFHTARSAMDYLERAGTYPLVVKADGLAAGKGVMVCPDAKTAQEHILDCFERSKFGDAGETVLIEEFAKGTECSVQVVASGTCMLVLDPARDYKRAYDDDTGPNTGGMGCVSPAPFSEQVMQRVEEKILVPTVHAMIREGHAFQGLLYAGLMLAPTGPR
ncbi:phosphoribosylamine--glycine ligase, partial [Planctomycetota bacterium]|nr:phosphoribosylamine--glycine ligase [Planctomycetota bacterium]